MTAEQLAAIAGVVLSLAFSYIPGLSDWYTPLDPVKKSLIMAGVLVAVAIAVFALACGNLVVYVTCDKAGALGLVSALIAALVANQATFMLSPRRAYRR